MHLFTRARDGPTALPATGWARGRRTPARLGRRFAILESPRLSSGCIMFVEHTPIEVHLAGRSRVYVKRDDLYGSPPAPPLAKLRGARLLLDRLHREGVRCVGTWDTPVSRLGHGIAAVCSVLPEMRCIVSYPTARNRPVPAGVVAAQRLGATVLPVRGGGMAISVAA